MKLQQSLRLAAGLLAAIGLGAVLIEVTTHGTKGSVPSWLAAVFGLLGAAAGAAITSLATLRYAIRERDERRLAELELTSLAIDEDLLKRGNTKTPAQGTMMLQLLGNIAMIERRAAEVVEADDASSKSLIRLREALRVKKIWDDSEVADFDRAVRVRNSIVHGDAIGHDTTAITSAIDATSRLLARLVAADRR